jgi:hypothetical protein
MVLVHLLMSITPESHNRATTPAEVQRYFCPAQLPEARFFFIWRFWTIQRVVRSERSRSADSVVQPCPQAWRIERSARHIERYELYD